MILIRKIISLILTAVMLISFHTGKLFVKDDTMKINPNKKYQTIVTEK